MLVKIHKHWVNPTHVVLVYSSHSRPGSTEVRMSPEESAIEVPLPLDEVVEKLNAGDLTDAHIVARNALEDILRALDLHATVDPDWLRTTASAGLGRLPV